MQIQNNVFIITGVHPVWAQQLRVCWLKTAPKS
jgi:hypothetical protein